MAKYNWRTIENCQKTIDEEKELLKLFSQYKNYDYVPKETPFASVQRRFIKEENIVTNDNDSFDWNKHHPIYQYIDECESVIRNMENEIESIKYEASPEGKKELIKKGIEENLGCLAKIIFYILLFSLLVFLFGNGGDGECTFYGIHTGCQ